MQAGYFQSVESGLDLENVKGVEVELEIGSHLLSFPRSAGRYFFVCFCLSCGTARSLQCSITHVLSLKRHLCWFFNFLESFLDIIVLVGEKWGGG